MASYGSVWNTQKFHGFTSLSLFKQSFCSPHFQTNPHIKDRWLRKMWTLTEALLPISAMGIGHGPLVAQQTRHGWFSKSPKAAIFHGISYISWLYYALLCFSTTQSRVFSRLFNFCPSCIFPPSEASDPQQILQGRWATCCGQLPSLAEVIQDLLNRLLRGKWCRNMEYTMIYWVYLVQFFGKLMINMINW